MFSVTHNMSKRKTVPVYQLLGFSHGLIFFGVFCPRSPGLQGLSHDYHSCTVIAACKSQVVRLVLQNLLENSWLIQMAATRALQLKQPAEPGEAPTIRKIRTNISKHSLGFKMSRQVLGNGPYVQCFRGSLHCVDK